MLHPHAPAERRAPFGPRAAAVLHQALAGVPHPAAVFRFDLETLSLPTGEPADLLLQAALPVVDLPSCLLDDLELAPGPERERVEASLYQAAYCHAASVLLGELLVGAESGFTVEYSALVAGLAHEGAAHLLAAAPAAAQALPAYTRGFWEEHAAALGELMEERTLRTAEFTPEARERLGLRWAPMKAPLVAAALAAGRPERLPACLGFFDEAATLFQIARDAGSLNRDLARGHCTYPVARALAAAGVPFGTPLPEGPALLALLLTDALPELAREALARAEDLCRRVEAAGFAATAGAMRGLEAPFREVLALYAPPAPTASHPAPGAAAGAQPGGSPAPFQFVIGHRSNVLLAADAAERFLTADPDLRESWEVHRWGFLNQPVLTARLFPMAVIQENLEAAGVAGGPGVERLLQLYRDIDFHYFDEPCAEPPDSDTLGVMLRLAGRSPAADEHRRILARPLGWLAANFPAGGDPPVFLMHGVDAGRDYGEGWVAGDCHAVKAGLLLGLLAYGGEWRRQALASAGRVLARYAAAGAGAVVFYDALGAALLMLELVDGVRAETALLSETARAAREAEARALDTLRRHRSAGAHSAQHAAVLLLASARRPRELPSAPAWLQRLLRTQRPDGAWNEEPYYVIPTRGNVGGWYSSRSVTTSICLRALAQHLGREPYRPS